MERQSCLSTGMVSRGFIASLIILCAGLVLFSSGGSYAAKGTILCPVVTGSDQKLPFTPHEGWVDVYARGDATAKSARIGKDGSFNLNASGPAALIASFDRVETLPMIVPRWPIKPNSYDISLWGDYICIPPGYPEVWDKEYMDKSPDWLQTFVAKSSSIYAITAFDGPPVIDWGNKCHGQFHDGGPDAQFIYSLGYGGAGQCQFQTAHHTKYEFPFIGFRHGDIPVTPGKTYTAHIMGYQSHSGERFELPTFVRPDNGAGYKGGQAYKNPGTPVDGDVCMIVAGNSNGQIVENLIRSEEWNVVLPNRAPVRKWGQTFMSNGISMSGLLFWATNGSDASASCKVRIREDGPDGRIIGPVKVAPGHPCPVGPEIRYPEQSGPPKEFADYNTPYCKTFQVAWFPDEVKLEPGKTYYLDLEFGKPVLVYSDGDFYPPGYAYYDGRKVEEDRSLQHGDKRWTLAAFIVTYQNPNGAPNE